MPIYFQGGSNGVSLPRDMIITNQFESPERQAEQRAQYWTIEPTTYYMNEPMQVLQTGEMKLMIRIACVWKPETKPSSWFSIPGSKLFEIIPPINPDQNIVCVNQLWFKNPDFMMLRANNFGYLYDWIQVFDNDPVTGELIQTKKVFSIQWIKFAYHIACDILTEPIVGLHMWECLNLLQRCAKTYNDSYVNAYNAR